MTKEWALNLTNVLPKIPWNNRNPCLEFSSHDPHSAAAAQSGTPDGGSRHFEIWFTGLRREQSPREKISRKWSSIAAGRQDSLEVSPLADWTWAQVWNTRGRTASAIFLR